MTKAGKLKWCGLHWWAGAATLLTLLSTGPVSAQAATKPVLELNAEGESGYLRLLLLFAALALAPAVLAVVTSFARIIIVLYFLRAGLGAGQIPPNVVLIGVAIFLTIFAMLSPLGQIYTESVTPLLAGEIDLTTAARRTEAPLRGFLASQARAEDVALFRDLAQVPAAVTADQVPITVLIPGFVLSELRAAFMIGFIIYLPFVVIDLVVASTLTSIGLIALPTPAIALPFKLLLFVMVDGWKLLTESLLATFQ